MVMTPCQEHQAIRSHRIEILAQAQGTDRDHAVGHLIFLKILVVALAALQGHLKSALSTG
jgi:hypothetical protein